MYAMQSLAKKIPQVLVHGYLKKKKCGKVLTNPVWLYDLRKSTGKLHTGLLAKIPGVMQISPQLQDVKTSCSV